LVVLTPDGHIEIFGYPADVFPPTDFHTATLVGDRIILIGRLGYPTERAFGTTPVFALDLTTYRIERLPTSGEPPGWIFEHEAELDPKRATITVSGGELAEERSGKQFVWHNVEEYCLHLESGRWERLTNRSGWRQCSIRREDRAPWFSEVKFLDNQVFLPKHVPHDMLPKANGLTHRIAVEGVQVKMSEDTWVVRVLIEGELPAAVANLLIEDIVSNLEAACGEKCRCLEF
jgi:hypothetical protein